MKNTSTKRSISPSEGSDLPKIKRSVASITDEFSQEVSREIPAESISSEETKTISIQHSVRHEVAIPPAYPYVPLQSQPENLAANPARTYKFALDPFQRVSIACLERSESVLVSAHTSAGKTVIAEYAIAMALRDKQRVIYTSPIKALSNQKYRELEASFGDVGLMTGDITISPTASCLVMTTEILRSMLYRGSEVMREVSWVIFDEIHYMRDKERGVVWEETIILMPKNVHFVFLSATIPNAKQFANWICSLHRTPCHVVYTDYRPTPLQHYVFPAGAEGIFLIVDEKGSFREENFQKAIASLGDEGPSGKRTKSFSSRPKSALANADLFKIVQLIMTKAYHPVIVFSFSKKDCESHALNLIKLDFNSSSEKDLVETVFQNAIDGLGEDDQKLPQISDILPLLKRGIGIHHSGLLPILKEVIEILFQEGLLKVLFATETFSIGLNMPARTVVFTNVRKFDGKTFRWISGGEYIQMSGRAGRRGLDDRGIVILMLDERMEPAVAKGMLKGQTDQLNSAFHLTYSMILNLMRVEGINPETMLSKSFFQFQHAESLPILNDQLAELLDQKSASFEGQFSMADQLEDYWTNTQTLQAMERNLKKILHHPAYLLPWIQPGRLAKVVVIGADGLSKKNFGWGCFVGFKKISKKTAVEPQFLGEILLCVSKTTANNDFDDCLPVELEVENSPFKYDANVGRVVVLAVDFGAIDAVSSVRVHVPKDLNSNENRVNLFQNILEIRKRFSGASTALCDSNDWKVDGIPLLHPIHDMQIKDNSAIDLISKISMLKKSLASHEALSNPLFSKEYRDFCALQRHEGKIKVLRKKIKETTAVIHLEELKCRKRVLRRLGYISAEDVIETKGRVACEISSGDELCLTEMMFNGAFNGLSVEEIPAILSCFVFQEGSAADAQPNPLANSTEALAAAFRELHETARRIARITTECKWVMDEETYVASFKPGLVDVVWAWCNGAKFSQICKMTSVFEGSIIRCMKRLEELLRQMCQAAKAIGNTTLESKFSESIVKIKRDIVFSNSLYL